MDIVRIATAGSVDDGKSTLIGRLLYDTRSVTKDKLEAVESSSRRRGLDFVDLSLLTDGLIAEREQGITIDVAHIYFATASRKYIIADTPGHIEYTRNMITGASNVETSIVLIDARNGVIEQTRRHLFISALLRIDTVFVCVNKMDLVGFDGSVFASIRSEVEALADKIGFAGALRFVPIVAKDGDNVVHRSTRMPWYDGAALLESLESLPVRRLDTSLPARFPVQYVIRPHSDEHHDYRGYAGRLLSGMIQAGQEVEVLPSGRKTTVRSIAFAGTRQDCALAGESVSLELDDDVDISRGDMIVASEVPARPLNAFAAMLAWMDEQPLAQGKTYILQHGVNRVKAKITVQSVLDIATMETRSEPSAFGLNAIGSVHVRTAKPVFADSYATVRRNGAFILIDAFTNNTVAVGIITEGAAA
ncbi:MAG: sulfate adenylyltransferase [Flaviaesturariibacter sp.]|nr:sulfate adenylyltransferase [Flaviaesturariibacter sp.]